MFTLKQIWQFRSYILGSVSRDFRLRYLGSATGAALVFLLPAFQIALYVLVFGNLLKGRLPGNPTVYGYSIYLCSGILLWNFFGELLQKSQGLYLDNANLLKKAAFPRISLTVINFLSASINFWLALFLFFGFLAVSETFPGWAIFGVAPIWLAVALLAIGIGLSLAVLQVFFRDFGPLSAIALQALFWSTPIVYPAEILPEWLLPWLALNPLFAPVSSLQGLMLGSQMPGLQAWVSTMVVSFGFAWVAFHLYQGHRADLMDNL